MELGIDSGRRNWWQGKSGQRCEGILMRWGKRDVDGPKILASEKTDQRGGGVFSSTRKVVAGKLARSRTNKLWT